MSLRKEPTLVRDDPDRAPLVGNIKVTREDWLNLSRNVLIEAGVGDIKILSLAERMGVSRSSFYWYFQNRRDLLEALLQEWEVRNTQSILANCALTSRNMTEAACNFFRCFLDQSKFDHRLDFAVREWARRDQAVHARIKDADEKRLAAVNAMFIRHGYDAYDAECRARVLYYMQIGYHALDVREPTSLRLSRVRGYLQSFIGHDADQAALDDFADFARAARPDP